MLIRGGEFTADISTKDPKHHLGDWFSIKSPVHSRVKDSAILILFLIFHDRGMIFKRWTFMLDVAIQKVEKQLLQTDKSFITDKKMLLMSMKQIMLDFCRNINVNDPKKRPISLRIVFCYNIKCKCYILNVLDLAIKFLK